ncbi:MAG: HPr-rel-A system PqqD family peptide chaperone [Pirellulales bacterium]
MSAPKPGNLVFNDDGFLFDSTTGDSFMANPTAVAILRGLQEDRSENEIVRALVERFDVAFDDALDDLTDFMASLKSLQL